jgi:signal transduction histidine kinase
MPNLLAKLVHDVPIAAKTALSPAAILLALLVLVVGASFLLDRQADSLDQLQAVNGVALDTERMTQTLATAQSRLYRMAAQGTNINNTIAGSEFNMAVEADAVRRLLAEAHSILQRLMASGIAEAFPAARDLPDLLQHYEEQADITAESASLGAHRAMREILQADAAFMAARDLAEALAAHENRTSQTVYTELVGASRNAIRTFILGALGSAMLGGMLAWAVARAISVRIERLAAALSNQEHADQPGDLSVLSRVAGAEHGRDEIGVLASSFLRLSQRLTHFIALLNDSRQHAERTLHDLKETQSHLIEAEKMAALGMLVAGVAHEINTPVGVTLSAASHLHEQTATLRRAFDKGEMKKSKLSAYMATADETTRLMMLNIDRASTLIQSFKQVAADQTSEERRHFDLRNYVDEVLTSLRPKLRNSPHQIDVRIEPGIGFDSYPGALAQVITNLLMNALIHAFPDGQSGTLTIAGTRTSEGHVSLAIADDGVGMDDAVQRRIFEPFYTTRRSHGGTGLGLHIVFNLVTHTLGGRIGVESQPSQGACFTLDLPTCPARSVASEITIP